MDIDIEPQFYIARDYSQICANIIMPLIDISEPLQTLFTNNDANVIATKLNTGLNEIAELLITKRKRKNSKEKKSFYDQDLREARREIKAQNCS